MDINIFSSDFTSHLHEMKAISRKAIPFCEKRFRWKLYAEVARKFFSKKNFISLYVCTVWVNWVGINTATVFIYETCFLNNKNRISKHTKSEERILQDFHFFALTDCSMKFYQKNFFESKIRKKKVSMFESFSWLLISSLLNF